jgi:GNAT superfamily N-acetyltransferase
MPTPLATLHQAIIRPARPNDREALRAMQALSICVLGGDFYSPEQLGAYVTEIGTMDDFLIEEGTYYVAEMASTIIGSGGWSRRTPSYANATGTAGERLSEPGVPKIRSVYVHPGFARRGIARTLMERAEGEALAAGYRRIELSATLSGVPLYRSLGYRLRRPLSLQLSGGVIFPGVAMEKDLQGRPAWAERIAS